MIEEFSKYERARILGARALQISMDAPILLKIEDEILSGLNFDPLRIAEMELASGVLPISVKKPMPQKKNVALKKLKILEESEEDSKKIEKEEEEEKQIVEAGEIMELANPEEEQEDVEETPDSEAKKELS